MIRVTAYKGKRKLYKLKLYKNPKQIANFIAHSFSHHLKDDTIYSVMDKLDRKEDVALVYNIGKKEYRVEFIHLKSRPSGFKKKEN